MEIFLKNSLKFNKFLFFLYKLDLMVNFVDYRVFLYIFVICFIIVNYKW